MSSIPIFVQQIIGVAVRAAVIFLAGWLAAHGGTKYDEGQITHAVEVTVPVIAVLLWSVWQKYGSRLKLVTAIAHPNLTTEAQVEAKIADPATANPSVLTPTHETPKAGV